MIKDTDLKEIKPKPSTCSASPEHVGSGVPIPKVMRIRTFSPDDWEDFIEEWSTSMSGAYAKVRRFGGSRDLGVDIAGFTSADGFQDIWDNYQCKRYDHPLRPSDIWVEIGKIVYYSFKGEYLPPRKHFFVASQGIGTSLEQLLNKPDTLKNKACENWDKHCKKGISSTQGIPLTSALETYFDAFDFSIFSSKSHIELIEGHSTTGYHAIRFGGGLPLRPASDKPPATPAEIESRYIRQLLNAYGDQLGTTISDPFALDAHTPIKRDFLRQRERFYHAESLRNFARDTVPEGTYAALQDEVCHGVIDICEGHHADGFERMRATLAQAAALSLTANPLSSVTKKQDCQGICHQLANDDLLTWVPKDG
ncbi:ABC-three component system protein [Roseibium sp. MMSF_3544]|uniref:ABC-three component system protein n=1 Tax=unclassified Roseibium TaxID=2629323 RepID=UPI00273DAEE5|nr:ABC-three component system protein [Roseibium sp. MMSF_3544]